MNEPVSECNHLWMTAVSRQKTAEGRAKVSWCTLCQARFQQTKCKDGTIKVYLWMPGQDCVWEKKLTPVASVKKSE